MRKSLIVLLGLLTALLGTAGDSGTAPAALGQELARGLPKGLQASILFAPTDGDLPRAEYNIHTPRTPASTQKLLTAWAVLKNHGPAHTFPTYVAVLKDQGKTYLRIDPSASPDLLAERLWLVAQQVRAHGIHRVDGVFVKENGIAGAGSLVSWPKDQDNKWYFPHIEGYAYGAGLNTLQLFFKPGEARPRVAIFPPNDYLQINNLATQKPGRSWIRLSSSIGPGGAEVFRVEGNVSGPGNAPKDTISIRDPNTHFIEGFCTLLKQNGIEVRNCLMKGTAPGGFEHLFFEPGRPLRAMVTDMNKVSSNLFAEYLLRSLTAQDGESAGTFSRSAATLQNMLSREGLPMNGVAIKDGSGLSKDNKLTAHFLGELLNLALEEHEFAPEYLNSLSVGGSEGTLRRRLGNLPHGAVVRGKSGHLNRVTSLAGYLCLPGKKPVPFVIFLEGPGASTGVADQIVGRYLAKLSG